MSYLNYFVSHFLFCLFGFLLILARASLQRTVQLTNDWYSPHYFKHVHISVIALIKMVIHARSGGIYEIMGMMQGKVRAADRSLVVVDSFALPVQGGPSIIRRNGVEY